jgi:hypothetical protein
MLHSSDCFMHLLVLEPPPLCVVYCQPLYQQAVCDVIRMWMNPRHELQWASLLLSSATRSLFCAAVHVYCPRFTVNVLEQFQSLSNPCTSDQTWWSSFYLRQQKVLHFFAQTVVQHVKCAIKRVSRDVSAQLNSCRAAQTSRFSSFN